MGDTYSIMKPPINPMEQYLYIIRHGETEYNRLGIVQGSGIDSDLNWRGKMQATAFFNKYKAIPFDKIYVSALRRTLQSVEGFIDTGIPYEIMPELNEISWGDFEGIMLDRQRLKVYWEIVREWQKGNLDISYRNAESPAAMQERQKIALEKIKSNTGYKNILVVTHGRYLRAFVCLLLNYSLYRMDEFKHSNLCLYVFRFNGIKYELIEQDDTSHLKDLI